MRKWVNITLKFKYFILAISAFSWLLYWQVSLEKEGRVPVKKIQELFLQQEQKIKRIAPSALHYFKRHGSIPVNEACQVHIYKQDRLIKWNTNKVPISNFSSIQFPSRGLIQLQNGWYFNPVQDGNGDWIISTQEIDNNTNPDVIWVKDLPLIEYVPLPEI